MDANKYGIDAHGKRYTVSVFGADDSHLAYEINEGDNTVVGRTAAQTGEDEASLVNRVTAFITTGLGQGKLQIPGTSVTIGEVKPMAAVLRRDASVCRQRTPLSRQFPQRGSLR